MITFGQTRITFIYIYTMTQFGCTNKHGATFLVPYGGKAAIFLINFFFEKTTLTYSQIVGYKISFYYEN